MRKTNKETNIDELSSWNDELYLYFSKLSPASRKSEVMHTHLMSSTLISLISSQPSNPHGTHHCWEGRAPAIPHQHQEHRSKQEDVLLQRQNKWIMASAKNQLLFLMGCMWLISYQVCYAGSSSCKSTQFRGQRKGMKAKDEQLSQEALILNKENRNRGKWQASPLWGSGKGRSCNSCGGSPGSWDPLTSEDLGCHGAILTASRFHQHFLPQFLSCGQQQVKRKKNLLFICILMASGSLNSVWKGQEESGKRQKATKINSSGMS